MQILANIIDIENRTIFYGQVDVENGKITGIKPLEGQSNRYILPGFVDAHVHIESSMLVPSEFARLAVTHGTVATVSDPHEIANVMGIEGVYYMINNGKQTPFKFNFGAPSCVPATSFETAGAVIGVEGIETLMKNDDIPYLAEMMNYPGVLFNDPEVIAKIAIAQKYNKPVDGHAPGLMGEDAAKYASAGISTDHECFTYEEALGKLNLGMKILIREGSAAKNFDALIGLLPEHFQNMMFCSDDKHPDDLMEGHINQLVARALKNGCELFDVLQAACVNPVKHYNLNVGLLKTGDPADFIITSDLQNFKIEECYINGTLVAAQGKSNIPSTNIDVINNFQCHPKVPADFQLPAKGKEIHVIEAINGEIVTQSFKAPTKIVNGMAVSDRDEDHLKMTVVNRYQDAPASIAFIKNFNLKSGAIASCVGHDSHNIIAVGVDDESLCAAVNAIIKHKGGVAAVNGTEEMVLPLPIAGIMSDKDGYEVGKLYAEIDKYVKESMGCTLTAPFMTLSFMALLVIPELKLSDKGLFNGKSFKFLDLFVAQKADSASID